VLGKGARIIIVFLTLNTLHFTLYTPSYALDLARMREYFLRGDYSSCIKEGERILADTKDYKDIDAVYYLLGLSYMKEGNYLRASDIFEIILQEFKNSPFKEEAKLGLADTYFLRGDYTKASSLYKDLMSSFPQTKLKAQLYYRISQCAYKTGNTLEAEEYSSRLKKEFPLNIESELATDLNPPASFYTVQVGCFSNKQNAQNLTQRLIKNNYPAYIEELNSLEKTVYRVRVGKFKLLKEAEVLRDKLSREGYPTKIYP